MDLFPNKNKFPMLEDYILEDEEVYVSNLKQPRIDYINALVPVDIKNIEIVGEWTDDHLPCLDVKITTIDQVIPFGAFWLCDEFVGAFYYWKESNQAKQDIIDYMQDCITQ